MLIVLTGIDGAGKTTAAQATVEAARQAGVDALLLSNYAGRRRMSVLAARVGVQLGPKIADAAESVIRTAIVLVSHARAYGHPGLVVMDRHLYCQLALREARGLRRGRFLPWLIRLLPTPDLIIHLVIDPEQAHRRVLARGTDTESLSELKLLAAAYRSLPEFGDFTEIAAEGAPAEVLSKLTGAMRAAVAGQASCQPAGSQPG